MSSGDFSRRGSSAASVAESKNALRFISATKACLAGRQFAATNQNTMFQNHLKLAWRRLLNNRLFSAVQLVGLTAGISACLLIGLFIHHEWTYDTMHAHAGRIVKVNMEYSFGGEVVHTGVTGNKVAPTLAREFPEDKAAVRVMQYTEVVKSGAMPPEEERFFYADSTFFRFFRFPLLKGDAATALRDPGR